MSHRHPIDPEIQRRVEEEKKKGRQTAVGPKPSTNGRHAKPGSAPKATAPDIETFTAANLMGMQLPEPKWAVEGIVPEGLSILAGKPKLGKSWLALHLAYAISSGGMALGKIPVEGGSVLYISLEDTKRRLQSRIRKLLGPGESASPRLHLARAWPRLDKDGLGALGEWIQAYPDARLIIVDTWARFRPVRLGKSEAYELDYQDGAMVKAIADKYGIAIIIVHHCRKLGAADAVEEVSGSVGLTGACDGVLVMRRERGQRHATLTITGRDVDESEQALTFDATYCLWQLVGPAEDFRISKERSEILALFDDGQTLSLRQVESLLGQPGARVRKMLSLMARDGQLETTARGSYRRPLPPDQEENPFID